MNTKLSLYSLIVIAACVSAAPVDESAEIIVACDPDYPQLYYVASRVSYCDFFMCWQGTAHKKQCAEGTTVPADFFQDLNIAFEHKTRDCYRKVELPAFKQLPNPGNKDGHCDSSPCLNGGVCHPQDYGFWCECPAGFAGSPQCAPDTVWEDLQANYVPETQGNQEFNDQQQSHGDQGYSEQTTPKTQDQGYDEQVTQDQGNGEQVTQDQSYSEQVTHDQGYSEQVTQGQIYSEQTTPKTQDQGYSGQVTQDQGNGEQVTQDQSYSEQVTQDQGYSEQVTQDQGNGEQTTPKTQDLGYSEQTTSKTQDQGYSEQVTQDQGNGEQVTQDQSYSEQVTQDQGYSDGGYESQTEDTTSPTTSSTTSSTTESYGTQEMTTKRVLPSIKLGDACETVGDVDPCEQIISANARCSGFNGGQCECRFGYKQFGSYNCLQGIELGDACVHYAQCEVEEENSTCQQGVCACKPGFRKFAWTCRSADESNFFSASAFFLRRK